MNWKSKISCSVLLIIFIIILFSTIGISGAIDNSIQLPVERVGNNNLQDHGTVGESQRYLSITKEFVPYKDIYLPNENITVYVEVRLLKYRDMSEKLDNLNIYELIDDGVSITSRSDQGLVTDNLNDLCKYKKNPNIASSFSSPKSRFVDISWDENIGELHLAEMESWERLIYCYSIRPKSAGTFLIDTIARTPYFTDIDEGTKLNVGKAGLYDVNIIPSKNKVFQKEPFQVYYTITYLGEGQTSATINSESNINKSFNYENAFNSKLNLSKYESGLVLANLSYTRKGSYTLPGIYIDGSYYVEDKTIIVDSFFERYWQFFQVVLLLVTIISSVFAFLKYGAEKNNDRRYSLYELFKDMKSDILGAIKQISIRTSIILGSMIVSLAIYATICIIYPGKFIDMYIFIIDNWVGFEIALLLIFIYIVYRLQKMNLMHHNENIWINWLYAFILIILWLIMVTVITNFSGIKDIL